MTPATVKQATQTLARAVENRHAARSEGAALGRTLAAEIRAREVATEQLNAAAAMDLELALLQLAASGDELVAEVADSALHALREQREA